jgi:hypothetical protein
MSNHTHNGDPNYERRVNDHRFQRLEDKVDAQKTASSMEFGAIKARLESLESQIQLLINRPYVIPVWAYGIGLLILIGIFILDLFVSLASGGGG